MLRNVLIGVGVLCLLGALAAVLAGHGMPFLPQLIAGAVILGLGVPLERWRYKRVGPQPIDPAWQDTGERFIDPETGLLTAVYFDPRTAERHYVANAAAAGTIGGKRK